MKSKLITLLIVTLAIGCTTPRRQNVVATQLVKILHDGMTKEEVREQIGTAAIRITGSGGVFRLTEDYYLASGEVIEVQYKGGLSTTNGHGGYIYRLTCVRVKE
jgi:hypothetical protein